jgi:hypothetical protein
MLQDLIDAFILGSLVHMVGNSYVYICKYHGMFSKKILSALITTFCKLLS